MPPKLNPLPELIPARIASLRDLLRGALWQDRADLAVSISPVTDTFHPIEDAAGLWYQPIQPGERFGQPFGEWQQCWFRVEVPEPGEGPAGRRFFFWDCRGETTAYIDGVPWAGLDVAHPYCILPDRACTLWLDCGTYQTCIWYPGAKEIDEYGLRFDGAWTACRDLAAWEVFWDLDTLVKWLEQLLKRDGLGEMMRPWGPYPTPRRAHPVLRKLLGMLDEAFMAWETGGIKALSPALKRIFAAFPAESWQPRVQMVGHSHLDLVWMWPEIVGERKAVHTIATALRLLDEYPQYRFLWTSPASMRVLEEHTPELYEEVKSRIKDGRWETTGGAWVEFDTLIACGEALGRSLALGQRKFSELRGEPSRTVWLPDCFGFNGFLPQIMAQAGIRYFYTTKLSWSVVTDFAYDSFTWRAADGSEVKVHLNVKAPSWEGVGAMIEAAEHYRQLDVHNEILKYTGVGDGGGGTTVDAIELYNRLGSLAQVPRVEWGTVEDFFGGLEKEHSRLPVYEGELYLEFHRGVYTTQSEFKRLFRRLERCLQTWEAARVIANGEPIPDHPWERLAFTQFHDAIPGSSIQLVYDQLGEELDRLGNVALEGAQADLGWKAGDAEGVFNPLAFERQVVAEFERPIESAGALQSITTGQGERWLAPVRLKGLAVTAAAGAQPLTLGSWYVTPTVLDNGVLRVTFGEQGQISSISDGKPWPLASEPGLALHPDHPATFDAWEIDHIAARQTVSSVSGAALKVVESGPVRAVLSGTASFGTESSVKIRYILEAGSTALKIEMDVDWQEEHKVLRYYLPTTLKGKNARYAAPYGSLERPQVPMSPREEAMWEVPASRWAAVTDDPGWDGLALLSEAKYGYACRDGELALTLLRAPSDPAADGPNPRRHMPLHPAEKGKHTIRFAIARYQPRTSGTKLSTPALCEALYAPAPLVTLSSWLQAQPPKVRFLSDLDTILPTWVLPAREGGFILRLNETLGASGTLRVALGKDAQVDRVDFLEQVMEGDCIEKAADGEFRVKYGPYELISLRVR